MDPRLKLHVHTINLYIRENEGYGDGYATDPIVIKNVYFDESTKLFRQVDDEEQANAWFSVFKDIDFKKGDMVEYDGKHYAIIEIERFKKPGRDEYEHTECLLKQSLGEQND